MVRVHERPEPAVVAPSVSPTIVQIPSPAPPLTVPLRVRGQTPLPASLRETPRARSPPAPIVLPQAPPPAPLVFELPTVAPAPSTSPTILRVISPRVGETVVPRPRPSPAPAPAPTPALQPSVVYTNSVVQIPTAPRTPNLTIRIRGTPAPDHERVSEPVPEHELGSRPPASPVLVPPSRHSVSDISMDQPRSPTPARERHSIPHRTPPEEAEERHERPPSGAAPIPPHPTVIQVPAPPPSRTAFIRMVTPTIPQSRPADVTTAGQPLISVEPTPTQPEPLAAPRGPSPPPPTILTVPGPFAVPTSQVRVKSRTQDRAPAQTLPLIATEPPAQLTEPAPAPAPAPIEEEPGPGAPLPSHSPVVIELPGEIPPATGDTVLRQGTIQVRSQPAGYSPIVIGTPARPPTVTLRARSRSQVRGQPMVHELPASMPTTAQQVIFGRSDEGVVPGTHVEAAMPRLRGLESRSFLIHSPRPLSAAPVPVAQHLENLANQEAQRARDARIRQLLEEQRAFMEEHNAFMARATRATTVAQDFADDTAAMTASLRASVEGAAEEIKRRSSAMASVHSVVLDEHAAALAAERQRAQELEEKLAALRTRRAEQRENREKSEQEKCELGRIAAAERHQDIRDHLGDITNRMQNAGDERAKWRASQDQRWAENQDRQDRKTIQVQRLEEMMERIMIEQDNARRMADEDAVANAGRPGYAEVIAQLEWQNDEQLVLLRTLLACKFVVTPMLRGLNIHFPQRMRRISTIGIAKRSRPCGKLPKNTSHLIFPTI